MDICNEAVMLLEQDPYLEDEQKEALALVLIAVAVNKAKARARDRARKGVRKAKTVWVREWLLQRQHHGWYDKLMKHLEEGDVRSFKNFLRVDPEMFRKLVAHLTPRIQKQDTNFRKALPPGLKVAITLRFLATGNSYKSLSYGLRVTPNTIVSIVPEVCQAIYDEYHEEAIKCPSTPEEWKEVAKDFSEKWSFHHVCGALDGKHVRILAPPGSGSVYYNYKGYFSIIMLALVDADYKLMYLNVGTPGADSDAGIFRDCSLFKALDEDQANLPPPEPFPGGDQDVPYFLVGDDAFALRTWMMKPYSKRQMTHAERIFNYRLSKCRRIVENSFGILANRFRCFHTMMMMRPQTVEKVVLAACTLHNMMTDIRLSADREDPHTHEVAPGEWRQHTNQQYKEQQQQQQEQVPDDEDLDLDVPHLDQE
uniref:putative nuclease HARBI1 n=1 Tax=Myxine glutinosa TaxID=7769 RepID=UPI00358EEA32